jgi:mannan endo-1,4-beta-mannosidase
MKKLLIFSMFFIFTVFISACIVQKNSNCFVGAFISDKPASYQINDFKNQYGKKPFFVMCFVDWEKDVDKDIIKDVYEQDCVLFVTWEPWYSLEKKAIDYDGLFVGKYDEYIIGFAEKLKAIEKEVFLRFGHEVNGNWYPWAGNKIGKDKYIKLNRYIRDLFDKVKADNVKWVFSVNWEDVPAGNNYYLYYPGDNYVDYIGIDGYNWGDTKSWSRWMSFKNIFSSVYKDIVSRYDKPLLITEFASTSSGGNKKEWIKQAMTDIKNMPEIKGFVLFNVDKETDWSFNSNKDAGMELKKQLKDSYFIDKAKDKL